MGHAVKSKVEPRWLMPKELAFAIAALHGHMLYPIRIWVKVK
jgi:hypothetical protein